MGHIIKRFIEDPAKRVITKALAPTGYALRRAAPIDLRGKVSHPLEALYHHQRGRPLLIEVDPAACRGLGWFKLDCETHPLISALRFDARNVSGEAKDSPLYWYYQECRPNNAALYLGLDKETAPGLWDIEPEAWVMPWWTENPHVKKIWNRRAAKHEAHRHGIDNAKGFLQFGPVSIEKVELELHRLQTLCDSIQTKGYARNDMPHGDIVGTLLIASENEWCLQINTGHHRAAVLSSLGYEKLPVRLNWRLNEQVRREDCPYWPQVRAGRITEKGALSVFDRVMVGTPPPACQWNPREYMGKPLHA